MFRDGWSGVLELERGEALGDQRGWGGSIGGKSGGIDEYNISDDYAVILVQLL